MKHQYICSILAAKRCHAAGQSVKSIAQQAGRSVTTIRRWLKL